MAVYLIACELKSKPQVYDVFFKAIGGYDSQQLLEQLYVVQAPTDADTLREHLSEHVGPEDRILVSRLTEDHSGYVMAPAAEWLEQHKPL